MIQIIHPDLDVPPVSVSLKAYESAWSKSGWEIYEQEPEEGDPTDEE